LGPKALFPEFFELSGSLLKIARGVLPVCLAQLGTDKKRREYSTQGDSQAIRCISAGA
jgi:hypothetical protein